MLRLHPDGSIIDGRNRYNACIELGIEPEYRTYEGKGSMTSFTVSMNLMRRHLNSGQRGISAANALPHWEAEAKERQKEAGEQYGEKHPREEGILP